MAKPGSLPLWATTGPKTTPTGGKQAAGWAPSERAAAQYFNWWQNLVYTWILWLNGLFDGSGNLTLDSGASITASGAGGFVISGTGKYKRPAAVRKIAMSLGTYNTANGFGPFTWTAANVSSVNSVPLVVTEGERITQVVARVACGATDVMRLRVFRYDAAAGTSTLLGTAASSVGHASAIETLTVTSLTETVSAVDHYVYIAQIDVTTYSSGGTAHGLELTTDVP